MKPQQYWCIGRNFSDHVHELNNPVPERPLIFLKSGGCLQPGPDLVFPDFCNEIHHELEVVLYLGPQLVPTHWTLGLDLTERQIQNELKQLGQPWELCKSFIGAAALGPWQRIQSLSDLDAIEFTLEVNGLIRQSGRVSDMIFPTSKLIEYLASRFPVRQGDAVFTGTPSGVAALKSKDKLVARAGQLTVEWSIR